MFYASIIASDTLREPFEENEIKMENLNVDQPAYSVAPLSFSMNSLEGCTDKVFDSSTGSTLAEMTTNSLNRRPKRKANRDAVRRSWGPKDKEEGANEFWASIQEPYNFIMGTNLMPDSVPPTERREISDNSADMELSWDFDDISSSYGWNLSHFMDQYNQLYEWLIEVQVNSQTSLTCKDARMACQEELRKNIYRKKLFLDQGTMVSQKYPSHTEEISWRVGYLSNKWEQLEAAFAPMKMRQQDADIVLDIDHEETVVKRWLETMEGHIQPITCRLPKGCSIGTLQERFKDNQILLKDIEAHGPVLKSILRHYEKQATPAPPTSTPVKPRIPRKARSLEKRWHQIYLRSLEWHYYLEGVIQNFKESSSCSSCDSDDEPLAKCRRLSSSQSSVASDFRRRKFSNEYDSHPSENGSYIEDDYVRITNSFYNPELISDHLHLEEPMVTDSVVPDASTGTEAPQTLENLDISAIVNDTTDKPNANQSSLTGIEMASPNTGVYDFKHRDTDSEGNRSPAIKRRGVEISHAQKLIGMKSVKNRTSTFFEYDEEEQEKILQEIIDSAVLDPDWLKSNVATDSDGSEADGVQDKTGNASEDSGSHDLQGSPRRMGSDRDSLRKLISDADKLVKQRGRTGLSLPLLSGSQSTKQQRIRQWLATQRELAGATMDSCDASGELTTGESDCESSTSDKGFGSKGNGSLLSSENTPVVECPPSIASSASKVILRGKKRRQSGQRPWSISELNQLPLAQNPQELRFLRHTLESPSARKGLCSSESALNHLQNSLDCRVPSTISLGNNEDPKPSESDPSTPCLKTDSNPTYDELTVQDSPTGSHKVHRTPGVTPTSRKRKLKLRRRSYQSTSRRTNTDSGSEACDPTNRRSYTKSSSGSEDINAPAQNDTPTEETHSVPEIPDITVTDDSVVPDILPPTVSEEDSLPSPRPFILGPYKPRDPEVVTTQEDFSSLSEQAWDPYQDLKYLSEPYSEDIDRDAARRLLDFGDDYRKYIDSDGSSFIGIPSRQRSGITKPRLQSNSTTDMDSEAEIDSLHQVISESEAQLAMNQNILEKYANGTPLGIDLQAQVIATAKTNLDCLGQFVEALRKKGTSLQPELNKVQDLLQKWETLRTEAENRQRHSSELKQLDKHIGALRDQIKTLDEQCDSLVILGEDDNAEVLQEKLENAKGLAVTIGRKREDLVSLNVCIHQYLSESPCDSNTLKEDLTELYRLWDATQNKANSEVSRIEAAQVTWRLWQEETTRLQEVLKHDSHTLKVLDQAMQSGNMTEAMTCSAQDVAQLLNQRRQQTLNNNAHKNATNGTNKDTTKASMNKTEEIYSDSGTSGYESCSSDDLSERERRLAHLKKLAKELEATLLPGTKAWKEIIKTIADAENELQALQKQCRELFVRTAETLEEEQVVKHPFNGSTRRRSWCKDSKKSSKIERRGSTRGNRRNWAWRVMKASIPFQAVILLLLCVACLLEPNCCDNVNTLNLNFNPQLRFLYGPPPV